MRRAHAHANIWHHDRSIVLNPTRLDPLTLGWRYLDRNLVLVRYQVAPAPVSVLQLVGCIMRHQSVRKGAHAEGTTSFVPNYAIVVENATTVRTLNQQ